MFKIVHMTRCHYSCCLTWFIGVVGGEDAHAHDGGEADEDGAQPEDVAHALALGHGGSVTG